MSYVSHQIFNLFCGELKCPWIFEEKVKKFKSNVKTHLKKYENFTEGSDYHVECHSVNPSIFQNMTQLWISLNIQF